VDEETSQTQEVSQAGDEQRSSQSESDAADLVRQVAERVWQLWREELRRENERRGVRGRS
jgi:hypothetical protein